jgi:hypothetical protein
MPPSGDIAALGSSLGAGAEELGCKDQEEHPANIIKEVKTRASDKR